MRTIVPITCVLCIATASRADTPPAEAPPAAAEAPPAAAKVPPAAAPPAAAAATARRSHTRIPEIAASIVTGGIVIATAASYREWNQAHDRRRSVQWDLDATAEDYDRAMADTLTWKKRTWLLIGATFVSVGATAFLWMRNQEPTSFSVQPTDDGDGAAVSYSGRF
ncbi:MAG TPA: hypothetical protein VNO30_03000 [Kofleriaceae bacterium]|nr:hypothetical protein [Kofleriaceae bacterium]